MKMVLALLSLVSFFATSLVAPMRIMGQPLSSGAIRGVDTIRAISVRSVGGAFPGSLTEEITAKKNGDGYVLTVSDERLMPKGSRSERTLPLSQEDWDQLVKIVEEQDLLDWKPDRAGGPIPGGGAQEFQIEGERHNSQRWYGPVKNRAAPDLLFKQMQELANRPVKAQLSPAQQELPSGRPPQKPTTQTQQVVKSIPRFSGKGKARTTARVDLTAVQMKAIPNRKFPPPLSALELQQAGDAKIGTPYATLRSAHMREPQKASIIAMSPSFVNPEPVDQWGIFFPGTKDDPSGSNPFPPTLVMKINSQASGSYYLVDCSVSPGIYNVADEGGNNETVTVPENKHLLFHLDQADLGWHSFMITSPDHWQFASCEITRLN